MIVLQNIIYFFKKMIDFNYNYFIAMICKDKALYLLKFAGLTKVQLKNEVRLKWKLKIQGVEKFFVKYLYINTLLFFLK